MHLPASLFKHLDECVPEFPGLQERDRWALATMLWMFTFPAFRHRRFPSRMSLSKARIERIWGNGKRMREVVGYRYFKVLQGSNLVRGHTHAFYPVADLAEALRRCMVDPSLDRWIGQSGKAMRKFPRPISSLANGGKKHSIWKGLAPANSASIDTESLERLYADLAAECYGLDPVHSERDGKVLDFLHHRMVSICGLLKLARNAVSPGLIPVNYEQSSAGRLFGAGLSLQAVPREVRHAALGNCWDYDISNCHWTFVAQKVRALGKRCPAIEHYIAHKAAVRADIAKGAGITVADAKRCLSMILYGAPATSYHEAAIPDLIGVRAAKHLLAQPLFIDLHRDVFRARTLLIRNTPVRLGGWVNNELGLAIKAPFKPRHLLAHLLQGIEAKALMAIVEVYGERVQLCVHDGWVSRDELDVSEMEALIFRKTGYEVEIETEHLTPDSMPGIKTLISKKFLWNQHLTSTPEAQYPSTGREEPWGSGGPSASDLASAVAADTTMTGELIVHNRPAWNVPPRRPAPALPAVAPKDPSTLAA